MRKNTFNMYKVIMPYNENVGGFFLSIEENDIDNPNKLWWKGIAHCMFHHWNGFLCGYFWYAEGFACYYELKASYLLGINSESVINSEFKRRYKQYLNEIVNTSNDYSLQEACELYQTNHGFPFNFITYEKGSLCSKKN